MMLLINASPAAPGEHVLVLYQHPGCPEPLGHGDHLLHVGDAGRSALEVKVDDPVLRNVRLTGSLGDDGRNCWILVPIIGLILVWEVDGSILKVILDPLVWRLNGIMDQLMVILEIVIVSDVSDGFILSFDSVYDLLLLVVYFL